MKNAANVAVTTAKQSYQIELDYSESSIEKIEEILNKIHEQYLISKDDKGFYGLTIMYAAYLGEVFKRSKGFGFWRKNHPTFGKISFPFYKNEKECFFRSTGVLKES